MSVRPAARRTPALLPASQRHLLGRFSYGVTPALADEARAAGGARRWFDRQLHPATIPDDDADRLARWWPGLSRSPAALWRRQVDGVEGGWEVMVDYQRWVLLRRMRSRRQVLEVMTEFWENHFNVPASGDAQFTWRKDYGDAIRARALGRFTDLLHAAVTHPAMLISLDNVSSTAAHPNENLGRELLELHTVGREAYDEADVKDSARILTGWTVEMWSTFRARYVAADHARGRVRVLGFTHPNADADGRAVTGAYLRYLARHPATAARLARKLAVKFVRDEPPQALVDHLAAVYLRHDTDIRPVLRALVDSVAFAGSVGAKVRDPGEDLVATYRALDVHVHRPPAHGGEEHAANALVWQASAIGQMPFAWPRPDGQPLDSVSWSSPARLLGSMNVHADVAGGWWPARGVSHHPVEWWVPSYPIRFDRLVDHLARLILHRPARPGLLRACCQVMGVERDERITRDHPVVRWQWVWLLATLLDSPDFLTR